MINTLSFGAISSDPLNFRRKLDDEEAELFDNSRAVGKIGPVIAAFRSPPQAKRLPSNSPLLDQVGQFQ
jgi:hypothetical protein